ncbi:hypothetical protein LOY38_22940 [Pseudomonas sp. B21-015]|uniref:hypothetical protein n=1 Tax=Pseudomonas sp. B21-015 TaxID=2895473 RepID=UPI0021604580|nr:hypothetical protein [Pseudomonas sp. B21-015]UVM49193.1 hypothetical protein LOY38_22940 [Pseudomonas sp. B21-015]
MIFNKGEVICIASGGFGGYDRNGPYVAVRDFDISAFIEKIRLPNMTPLDAGDLMREIPSLLIAQGLLVKMPCRNVYLGAFGEFDLGEERDNYP